MGIELEAVLRGFMVCIRQEKVKFVEGRFEITFVCLQFVCFLVKIVRVVLAYMSDAGFDKFD